MMRRRRVTRVPVGSIVLGLILGVGPAGAAEFVVDDAGDQSDPTINGTCDATGPAGCTLRAAIQEANATATLDVIKFSIGSGLVTISPGAALPTITEPVTIDGTTQPGWIDAPIVEVNGASAGGAGAFTLNFATSSGSTIKGLIIDQFGGIAIRILPGSSNNVITGNYIGTDPTGTLARGNSVGVFIQGTAANPASGNRIGGTTAAERNIISGNSVDGIQMDGAGATDNVVEGNYIGLDADGSAALGNTNTGVAIFGGASNNLVGGTASGAGNVISGNGIHGVGFGSTGTTGNRVEGNLIGTDAAGTGAIPNGSRGADIDVDPTGNTIGGTVAGAGNVISGNAGSGVLVQGPSNEIYGNYVGLDITGSIAIPNGVDGIKIVSSNNTVGGTTAEARNVVAGNPGDGIEIAGSVSGNVVQGNYIGTAADGTTGIANNFGVNLDSGANNNTIGGTAAGAGNRIAHNSNDGVVLTSTAASGNQILSNEIFSNGGLGIDLNDDGVTANDGGDSDTGPNDLLNWPWVVSVQESSGTLTAYFKLDLPAGDYRIEFFKNPSGADGSGNGEGEVFASSVDVSHPGGGEVDFNHSFVGSVDEVITATTTECTDGTCTAFLSTSEFGNSITAVTTAVRLLSFTAVARDRAVDLEWETASELNNLGFHLYRSLSASGPYERITEDIIPGLGSSPTGATYSYRDTGLTNGTRYFYKLEDIETTGATERHGPVWATPRAGASSDEEEDSSESEGSLETSTDESSPSRIIYGDPSANELRVRRHNRRWMELELITEGFYAIPQDDGSVLLEVPGLEDFGGPDLPDVPTYRTWQEVVAGRNVRLASVTPFELTEFASLRPSSSEVVLVASEDGTVETRRRRTKRRKPRQVYYPESWAELLSLGFQGAAKKALVELAPLRWDATGERLVLARRLVVRLAFRGRDGAERTVGKHHQEVRTHGERNILARLAVTEPGLYAVSYESVFGRGQRVLRTSELSLSRQGEPVAFFVSPSPTKFRRSSKLYFLSEGASLNPYGREAVYELESSQQGIQMEAVDGSPSGAPLHYYWKTEKWEKNRLYQPTFEKQEDVWQWDWLFSRMRKSYSFEVTELSPVPGNAGMSVWLHGASDFPGEPDHHVRLYVNGTLFRETWWDGTTPHLVEGEVGPGLLQEGENTLEIEEVGDTEALYSMVMLDRFEVHYPAQPNAEHGELKGSFRSSGTAWVSGLDEEGFVFDRTGAQPQRFAGLSWAEGGVGFRVESGHRYQALSSRLVKTPEVKAASSSGLKNAWNRAEYLVIGPREFLLAAEPLLEHRRNEGLIAGAVATEDIFDEFGYGEATPASIRNFLSYAYHHWSEPTLRYVLLLGDGTYDPKNYLATGVKSQVPVEMVKTQFMWTASDPSLAAVNGEDILPDVAIGRLPASSVEEVEALVGKILAYEIEPSAPPIDVVLIADNPDVAGNFDWDADDLAATVLSGQNVEKIYLSQLGTAATRSAIRHAFDEGASLVNYIGHGAIHLWANENLFNIGSVDALSPQSHQPLLFTMNCLNGYFHFPYHNSLSEELLKAEGKGVIAAFSPTGLSLDEPAHRFHRALLNEIVHGEHARLGDAILAGQADYADTGAFPELLSIYHLLGDPALKLR